MAWSNTGLNTKGPTGPQGATGPAGTTSWNGITDKPTSFTPSAHTHPATDISNSTSIGRSVLTAATTADARTAIGAENAASKGQANGYASLDGAGKVPVSQLPNSIMEYQGTWNASTNTPTLVDGTGNTGDVYRVTVSGSQNLGSGTISFVLGDYAIYNGSAWEKADTTDAVASVNGYTGNITLTKGDVGLGSVDNTADASKNVLSATKLATARTIDGQYFDGTANVTVIAPGTTGSASKTTPVDADVVPLVDSEASFGLKKLSWANIKATFAAYYDSLVTTLSGKTLASPALTGTTSVASGGAVHVYNTGDLAAANFERFRAFWSGNTLFLSTDAAGTGTTRAINIAAQGGSFQVGATHSLTGRLTQSSTMSASSGSQALITMTPNINQSGTASYTALLINPTETTVGSGTKRLIDAQVGGSTKFAVDNAGIVNASTFVPGFATTATSGVTTTLTSSSPSIQVFTGSANQTVKLPATVPTVGHVVYVVNNSTGYLSLQTGDGVGIGTWAPGCATMFIAPTTTPVNGGWAQIHGYTSVFRPGALAGPAVRDSNANLLADAFISSRTQTATAAGTTTLTIDSTAVQEFTGTTTQTVRLPTTSVITGQRYTIVNNSTGAVTVQSSGGNQVAVLSAGQTGIYSARIDTPTAATDWSELVTTSGTQTLTSKTLTTPKVDSILDTNGNTILSTQPVANAVNRFTLYNGAAGSPIYLTAAGSDTNIAAYFQGKGSGSVHLRNDNGPGVRVDAPASAVNYFIASSNSTGLFPTISTAGSDTDISMVLQAKGAGGVYLRNDNGVGLGVIAAASTVNRLLISGSATGNPVTVSSAGTDTNIGINFVPKGTGTVQANGVPILTRSIQTVTSTVTLGGNANTDYVVFIGAGGAVTLPTAVGNTSRYTIKCVDSAAKTVSTTSSQTIDGAASFTLGTRVSIDVVSDGSNWQVV